jgi:iron(II)-dependent oxidoreductase
VADGGYQQCALWSEPGWRWRRRERRRGPRYWGDDPLAFARAHLDPTHPVQRLSYYEAEAYARWAGGRLPTEAEWERAACWDAAAERARPFPWGEAEPDATRAVFDRRLQGPAPVHAASAGASPVGCLGMAGGVWEWTATPFAPYPGFEPWPYAGYSTPYFDGRHFVLRGGSWASRRTAIRPVFRNWYPRQTCEVFAGVRVVYDAED